MDLTLEKILVGDEAETAADKVYNNDNSIKRVLGIEFINSTNYLTNDSTKGYYTSDGTFVPAENWRCVLIDTTKVKDYSAKMVIDGVAICAIGFKADNSFTVIQQSSFEGDLTVSDDIVSLAVSTRSLAGDVYYCYPVTTIGERISTQQEQLEERTKEIGFEDANKQTSVLTTDSDKGYFDSSGIWHSAENWRGVKINTLEQKKFNIKTVIIGTSVVSLGGFKADNSFTVIQQSSFEGDLTVSDDIVSLAVSARSLAGDVYYCYPVTSPKSLGLIIQDIKSEVAELENKVNEGCTYERKINTFIPETVYVVKSEQFRIYPYNLIGTNENDLSLDVFLDKQYSNELASFFTNPQSDETLTYKIRNYNNVVELLGNINLKIIEPKNPVSPLFVLPIGDSLTEAYNGIYVNELSRLLTGVGDAIDNGGVSKNFSNIKFIGTLGNRPVKHEGRGGWSLNNFLNSQANNAFYNPTKNKFDLDYYLSQNGFYSNGVTQNGSNLVITIMLNWNSVYNHTDTQFKSWYNELLGLINTSHPQARILIFGINTPPGKNYKSYKGNRNVSRASIIGDCIHFETMLREIAGSDANKSFCTHFPILPFFCADGSYPTARLKVNLRTNDSTEFYTDYVHPSLVGYGQIADIFYRAICSLLV
ncbi:MAG: hypothetical protein RL662_1917 [Bacteroidota bacterium]|jgi:lysophospholipase L1-like esterase